MKLKLIILFSIFSVVAKAQSPLQYFRPNSKAGLNTFEPTKDDTVPFSGFKVRVGGNFNQDFQGLNHQNSATPVFVGGVNKNQLIGLTSGFNRAMANLNVDAQLADGIRLNLTMYLSSRHHEETWVKGGYVQLDKLPFFKSQAIDHIMQSVTIKIGDYELDYGDAHYRRTDGGNTIDNPFIENYIMDGFTTEVGGEIYFHPTGGFIAMFGVSNGELNPTVVASTKIDTATGKLNKYAPAFHGKIGFDRQINKDLRVRITGSFYEDASAASNSLFFGDRTGSHYFFVLENTAAVSDVNAFSGRYNPGYSEQVTTFMVNPFVKYKGFELFGTYENARGRNITEPAMRHATQYAIDLVYRFPEGKENFWIAARYNTVTNTLPGQASSIAISREVGSIGWFLTKNLMLKAEYVNQQYKDFLTTDIRSGGQFNGFNVEASVGF